MTSDWELEPMDWIDWDEGRDLDDEDSGWEPGEPDYEHENDE